eukprot:scaffold59973_cov52-Cyclotella_meneghiniana.AAC.1
MVLVGFALVWAAECRLLVTGELHGRSGRDERIGSRGRVCYPKFTRHPIPGVIGYTRLPTRPLQYQAVDTRIPTRLFAEFLGTYTIDG